MSINVDIVGQLVPNPISMLVQLCSTLVLFLLIKKFLWKPVQNFFNARENAMQADLKAASDAKAAAEADRKEAGRQLQDASGKADEIVNAAVKEAKAQKYAILESAGKEADAEKRRAHEQIENERQAMVDSMKNEMINVALDAAGKLIGSKADEETDCQAVDAFVKEASAHDQ